MTVTVVIPTINQRQSLIALVKELVKQGGPLDEILVFDNGHDPKLPFFRDGYTTRISAKTMNIHEMWNLGWDMAEGDKVCFLNDDLTIGPNFLEGLERTMDADPNIGIVSPNYDNRLMTGPVEVRQICGGRYDGTGGFAGFAFMVERASTYRFPDWLEWYCGDNHLLVTMLFRNNKTCVISDLAKCEHIDGGSQSGTWTNNPVIDRDNERWIAWLAKEVVEVEDFEVGH